MMMERPSHGKPAKITRLVRIPDSNKHSTYSTIDDLHQNCVIQRDFDMKTGNSDVTYISCIYL